MLTPLIVLLVLGTIALLWSDARGAAELAAAYGREACARAGVQWLDQSAHLVKLALKRAPDGRLRLQRTYRFEYSSRGDDRRVGSLALLGRDLQWISEPDRDAI
jgi:hypothetical protein